MLVSPKIFKESLADPDSRLPFFLTLDPKQHVCPKQVKVVVAPDVRETIKGLIDRGSGYRFLIMIAFKARELTHR